MRRFALAAILSVLGCAHDEPMRAWYLPQTAEAMSCKRECLAIDATCRSGKRVANAIDDFPRGGCEEERLECIKTCPGAYSRRVGMAGEDPLGGPIASDR